MRPGGFEVHESQQTDECNQDSAGQRSVARIDYRGTRDGADCQSRSGQLPDAADVLRRCQGLPARETPPGRKHNSGICVPQLRVRGTVGCFRGLAGRARPYRVAGTVTRRFAARFYFCDRTTDATPFRLGRSLARRTRRRRRRDSRATQAFCQQRWRGHQGTYL